MKKFMAIIFSLGMVISMGVVAQTPPKSDIHLKQPPFPVADSKFNEVKLLAVHSIEKRLDSLKKELACVDASKDRIEMSKCFNEAQERRQEIAEDLRSNKKNIKDIKDPKK